MIRLLVLYSSADRDATPRIRAAARGLAGVQGLIVVKGSGRMAQVAGGAGLGPAVEIGFETVDAMRAALGDRRLAASRRGRDGRPRRPCTPTTWTRSPSAAPSGAAGHHRHRGGGGGVARDRARRADLERARAAVPWDPLRRGRRLRESGRLRRSASGRSGAPARRSAAPPASPSPGASPSAPVTVRVSTVPGEAADTASCRSAMSSTRRPSTAVMTSPPTRRARRRRRCCPPSAPPSPAGPPLTMPVTRPRGGWGPLPVSAASSAASAPLMPSHAWATLPPFFELVHDARRGVDRDGEPDADVAVDARVRDLGGDADQAAPKVEQRAAGAAGVEAASVWIAPVTVSLAHWRRSIPVTSPGWR